MTEIPNSNELEDVIVVITTAESDGNVECNLATYEYSSQTCQFMCASGRRFGGSWKGVRVSRLFDSVDLSPKTTHLVVKADDGFQVCVPINEALDGILAIVCEGVRLNHSPRFISRNVDGTRTVKRVQQLEPISLDPGESIDEHEILNFNG